MHDRTTKLSAETKLAACFHTMPKLFQKKNGPRPRVQQRVGSGRRRAKRRETNLWLVKIRSSSAQPRAVRSCDLPVLLGHRRATPPFSPLPSPRTICHSQLFSIAPFEADAEVPRRGRQKGATPPVPPPLNSTNLCVVVDVALRTADRHPLLYRRPRTGGSRLRRSVRERERTMRWWTAASTQ